MLPLAPVQLPDFLPGKLCFDRGSARDYHALSRFHYAAGPPATWASVRVVRYVDRYVARAVAIGVLSWPVPSCRPRERFLKLRGSRADNLRFANQHIRTISRIIVHPQFRSLGLARAVAQQLCRECPTRFVEAIARMGHVHPLFQRAGMRQTNPGRLDEPAYFILERHCDHTKGAEYGSADPMHERRRAA